MNTTVQETDQDDDGLTEEARQALESGDFDSEVEHDEEEYGKRVQKRIAKEVSKRKALQDQLSEAETDRQRMRRELKEAKDLLAGYSKKEVEGLDSKAEDLKKRRDKALDDGDLAAYNDLNDELTEVKIEMRERRRAPAEKPVADDTPRKSKAPKMSQAASDWVEKNGDWLSTDKEKTAAAAKIEQQLVKEGYDVNDSDLYEELDRRLGSYDDPEPVGDVDEVDDDDTPPARGATTGVPRDSSSRAPRSRPGAINKGDLQKMARAGLDPNDPGHRKAWLDRNKPL